MASAIRPPSRTGSPTRSAVSIDQPLSVQEFLRSLRKATRPLATPQTLEALQDNTSTRCQLTVQGLLHGLRKPVTPLFKSAEAPKSQTIASTGLDDLAFIDTATPASGPGPLDPPKSSPIEIDGEQVLSPLPEAQTLRYSDPEGADEKSVPMKIPSVTRTYTKKAKHISPQQNDSAALFLTQFSTRKGALVDRLFDDGTDSKTEQLAPHETPKTKPAKKHTSVVPKKRRQQPLQENEEIHREDHSEFDADTVTKKKKEKTKRKKRRVPVNELALMKELPSREAFPANNQKAHDSNNAIDLLNEYLDEQGFPAPASPSLKRNRKLMKANTSKPVTRIRQQITMPQPSILAREGFKFPPITPRAKKSPGWRLGSGFEGLILQLTDQRPETSHHQKIRHARTPCILGRSPPELELSTRLSSTRQSIGQRDVAKRQNDEGGSVETRSYEPAREYGTADGAVEDGRAAKAGAKGAFEQVACLTALLRPPTEDDRSRKASSSHRNGNVKEPIQVHQSQNRDLDSSQAIREPSQSERNGWLKRRKVDSAVAWEDEEEQLFAHTQGTFVNAGEHGRKNARNGLDTFLDNIAQAQRTFYNDVPVFNKGGQTASNPEQPVKNRRQDMVQHEQKAKQHRHPGLRDAEQQSWHSEKILDHQSSGCHPEPPPSSGSEAEISTLPSDAKDLPTPKARHHVEVLRTSEVPETQGRLQESLDFDHTATESPDRDRNPYQIPKTTLDSGNYFSNAVRQLDFPEKASHTITWRRSRREPDQDVRDSQVMFDRQEGAHHIHVGPITGGQRFSQEERSLDSGVTPGLKRRMSKVPFRPPFKEPL